mgnify:CR=1 FL=1
MKNENENETNFDETEEDLLEESANEIEDTIYIYNPTDDVKGKFLQATDLFSEPKCTICNCKFRLEADQKYIDSIDPKTGRGSPAVIMRFLEKKGINVMHNSCTIHGYNHIRTKYDNDMPVIYGDRILDMRNELKNSEGQIDTAIAALFERLYKLGSYSNTDSLMRDMEITKGIAAVSDKLAKLWELKNKTLEAANEESTSQKLQIILTNILSKLPEEYHDVIREEIKKLKL